jgi:hypothetical protein
MSEFDSIASNDGLPNRKEQTMDINFLEKTWQTQTVTGNRESTEAVVARLKGEVTTARRRIRGGIALVAFVLVAGWIVSIVGHITAIKRLTPMGLVAEALYSILAAAFFVRAFRSARVVREENALMGGTLRESLAATLRTVELQIQNARIAGGVIPIVVAICVWLFFAKGLMGELRGFAVAASSAFTVTFGAAIGLIIWHRYRTHLLPRAAELKETLQSLDQSETA